MNDESTPPNRDQQERQFLHDLSTRLSIATLYAGLMQERSTLSHLAELTQALRDAEQLLQDRRAALTGTHGKSRI